MLDWERDCGRCDIYGMHTGQKLTPKKRRLLNCVRLVVHNQRQGVICIYVQAELEMLDHETFSNIISLSLCLIFSCIFNFSNIQNNLCKFKR